MQTLRASFCHNVAMPAKQTKQATKKPMSKSHKAALAAGREDGWAVRRYLEALEANKPKRGRKRTPDTIQRQLAEVEAEMDSANALNRLLLSQRRTDLVAELDTLAASVDLVEFEDAFIESAAAYSERKGISYDTWRKSGVSAEILGRAGIGR
jgi:hypothetical protein